MTRDPVSLVFHNFSMSSTTRRSESR
uniref:Uncharacterized protein n=1 Tax=Rhizophora mucronata TaxID=61149 RepID=A0A2P2N4G8_RHIMU